MVLMWIAILVASLVGLVKSSDWFTTAAERVGVAFGLSSFIVGATIVSIGSSMPELATGVITALQNDPATASFAVDNIIGSNIANILLIGGVLAFVVGKLQVKSLLIDVDLPFLFLATGLFILLSWDGAITLFEGILLLAMLVIFVTYTIVGDHHEDEPGHSPTKPSKLTWRTWALLAGSSVGIYFSADYTIKSVVEVANILNIAPAVVTMLAVAIGTSLPELILSIRAAQRGKDSIALGNIFGSNIFNVLAVAGLPALFGTLVVSPTVLMIGTPFLIVATLGFIFVFHDDKMRRWEGFALLAIYIAFVGKIIGII